MKTTVTKLYRFAASHRLHLAQLSEEENTTLYGKCNNPFGHGHDYILEVTAEGPVDRETGYILRAAELDALVQNCVLSLFEHRNINLDVPQFRDLVPTTENIAGVIAEILDQNWTRYIAGSSRLARVHVQETDRNGFEVRLPKRVDGREVQGDKTKVAV